MADVCHLTIQHRSSGRTLVNDLSFSVQSGDRIAIIGEEGNGKSTLLKYLFDPALTEPYAEARGSSALGSMRPAFLYQELPEDALRQSVYDYLVSAGAFAVSTDAELMQQAALLGFLPERIYDAQPVGTLSGGEKVEIPLTEE